ncbi:hypothetical protein BPUTEOMOX_2107 [methanotrophic endosymbiont of Bathymodiolus puteoserpentis (Logatchev)]|nr:hypothetical protein BPUTEOMOX_2107 [methanotrophic endosymbiont of Bathymodiolus puteoserpentis (Logatchev)]
MALVANIESRPPEINETAFICFTLPYLKINSHLNEQELTFGT